MIKNTRKKYMCGIIAYVGNGDTVSHILEGLDTLSNRGYDAAGVLLYNSKEDYFVKKCVSSGGSQTADCLSKLRNKAKKIDTTYTCGIGHTRWRTHGSNKVENAHPHIDPLHKRVAVVHNGVVHNCDYLMRHIGIDRNCFVSVTDTEVIAAVIAYYITEKKMGLDTAIENTTQIMSGTWAIVCIDLHDGRIIGTCYQSPLVIGVSESGLFFASEPHAVPNCSFYTIKEKSNIELGSIDLLDYGKINLIQNTLTVDQEKSYFPYNSWTHSEIANQTLTIKNVITNSAPKSNEELLKKLKAKKHLILTACGTSLNACEYIASIFRKNSEAVTVQVVDACEFDPPEFISDDDKREWCVIALTQSGETRDVFKVIEIAKSMGILTISIVNKVNSLIARNTDFVVYTHAGIEHSVCSTKSFTSQVCVMSLIGSWIKGDNTTILNQSIKRLPNVFQSILISSWHACAKIARFIFEKKYRTIFLVGRGSDSCAIAKEGALKLKEMTYIHAEGMSAGSLKHGPFALIDEEEQTPIIHLILNGKHKELSLCSLQETSSRGCFNVVITDDNNFNYENDITQIIKIPYNGPLTSLGAILAIQIIALELTELKKLNPDRPRNLAKTVTVD